MKQIAGFIASLLLTVGLSAEVREVFVENKGAEIFCRVEGKGSPLIVIHGGPGLSLDCLLPQMSELAKSHLVIFYDQRGCGHSRGEINSETINLEMFVSDLEAIRKVFDLEKVSILGHSWGAFLALQYAFVHPERVQKLVLSNGFPASSEDLGLFIQEYMTRMEPYQETLAKLHAHPGFKEGDPLVIKDLHRTILKTYFYNQEQVDLLSFCMNQEACFNGQRVYDLLRQSVIDKPFDLFPKLKLLNVDTLVIHGDYDPIPLNTAEHIHQTLPLSKFVILKDCGHFPYVEDPVNYFGSIQEFLNAG